MAQTLSAENTLIAMKALIDPWFARMNEPAKATIDARPTPKAGTQKAAGKSAAPAKQAAKVNGATADVPALTASATGSVEAAQPAAATRQAGKGGRPKTRTTVDAPPPAPASNGNGATAAA